VHIVFPSADHFCGPSSSRSHETRPRIKIDSPGRKELVSRTNTQPYCPTNIHPHPTRAVYTRRMGTRRNPPHPCPCDPSPPVLPGAPFRIPQAAPAIPSSSLCVQRLAPTAPDAALCMQRPFPAAPDGPLCTRSPLPAASGSPLCTQSPPSAPSGAHLCMQRPPSAPAGGPLCTQKRPSGVAQLPPEVS
jgi:hypothetical protein